MSASGLKNATVVRSSWLEEGGRRLDCGPYMSGALQARDALKRLSVPKQTLAKVTDRIFHAGREGRVWVDEPMYGVPFLGSSDILCADLSSLPLLSKKLITHNPLFTLGEHWTLITRSGTVGRMAYVRPDMVGMACSEHVLRVVPNLAEIHPGFLYAFLSSRYGVPMVVSGTYGAIIQHIEAGHIDELPVPRFGEDFEEKVHKLIVAAAQARAEGQAKHEEATSYALQSCGIPDISTHFWRTTRQQNFVVERSELSSLRAMNYDPRMVKLIEKIRNNATVNLGQALTRSPFRPNRFNRIDASPGHGVQLIGQKEMFYAKWEGRWISWSGIPVKEEVIPPSATIAVACIGTLGENEVFCRSIRVRRGQEKFALSDNVLQLRPNDAVVPSGYLFALLRSEVYFRIFRCMSVGGKQQVLHPELMKTVPIPLAEKSTMQEVDALIAEGDQLLDASVELNDRAVSMLERKVEDGQ